MNRRTAALFAGLLLPLGLPAPATTQATILSGDHIATFGNCHAAACHTCHGEQGQGNALAGFPRLAGLSASYLQTQLEDLADGRRNAPIMASIAKALSTGEMKRVARYYAAMPPPIRHATTAEDDAKPMSTGRAIAEHGLWANGLSQGVPACDQCHGPAGMGVGSNFPALAGQPASYLAAQLRAWQHGTRPPGPMNLMPAIARRLSDPEIEAVSAWFASFAKDARNPTLPATPTAPQMATPPTATAAATPANHGFTLPALATIPDSPFGDSVRLGYQVFTDTQRYAKAYVGNRLNCVNCHLDAGRLANSAPLWAAWPSYPAYRNKNHRVDTYADRLQGCFRFSMNGTPPPKGSNILNALASYSFWMARGVPTGAQMKGRGYPALPKPARPPDPARGQAVYEAHCALCHQPDGQGLMVAGQTQFPPLWGPESFTWGAGMHRIDTAAAFIKANMPLGLAGSLTDQQAWDVAIYVDSHERPQDPRFTGSVAETRKRFHDSPMSLYGRVVNGHRLGSRATPRHGTPR